MNQGQRKAYTTLCRWITNRNMHNHRHLQPLITITIKTNIKFISLHAYKIVIHKIIINKIFQAHNQHRPFEMQGQQRETVSLHWTFVISLSLRQFYKYTVIYQRTLTTLLNLRTKLIWNAYVMLVYDTSHMAFRFIYLQTWHLNSRNIPKTINPRKRKSKITSQI